MLPLVLVPGIQGRWEFMRPTVAALSARFRVLTFSLGGGTLGDEVDAVLRVLDAAGVDRAIVCGVSFGGAVALKFAATHPQRTRALVLASTPGPGWHLSRRHSLYARLPWLLGPLFLLETPWRMRAELAAALPDPRARRAFKIQALRTAAGAPISFSRMAARARQLSTADLQADCARVTAPTLIVTGEPSLDHVVPADGSAQYVHLIRGAKGAVIERTGHTGTITRPDVFAAMVSDFVDDATEADGLRSRKSASGT